MLKHLALLLFSLTLAACAGDTKKDAALNETQASNAAAPAQKETNKAVSIEAKLAAAEKNAANVTEVVFRPGTRVLEKDYVEKLNKALDAAAKKAPLKHLTILAWADREMPAPNQGALPDDQRKLANDRGEVVKAIAQQKHARLGSDIVNMADSPGAVQKFLRTDDFRIREALQHAGKDDKKASHAVLIIELKQ
jgi:hypothetical protein